VFHCGGSRQEVVFYAAVTGMSNCQNRMGQPQTLSSHRKITTGTDRSGKPLPVCCAIKDFVGNRLSELNTSSKHVNIHTGDTVNMLSPDYLNDEKSKPSQKYKLLPVANKPDGMYIGGHTW